MVIEKLSCYLMRGDHCPKCKGRNFVIIDSEIVGRTRWGNAISKILRCLGCGSHLAQRAKEGSA